MQPADSPATTTARFESVVLTHLDSAYNLARWLVRGEHDAQDVVQDACLRAFKAFGDFRGVNGRCWLLAIVRNVSCSWLDRNRRNAPAVLTDDDLDRLQSADPDPQRLLLRQADAEQVRQAIEQLPDEFREVVVLREIEGLSYKEVAAVAGVPVGTVMSRLARARQRLARELTPPILLKEARP